MSFQANVYQILIASPSDVAAARLAIQDAIHAWNAEHAAATGVMLLPVIWERDAFPKLGDRPQAIINKQLVDKCDVLVGAFWTRLGTHTGVAESGTVEEIEEFYKAGKPVMLYFSSMPVTPDSVDLEQYKRLKAFKKQIEKKGTIDGYNSEADLRARLARALTETVRELGGARAGSLVEPTSKPNPATEAAERLRLANEQFAAVLDRAERDWATERAARPGRLERAKLVLRTLASKLLDLQSYLGANVGGDVHEALERAVLTAKELQEHEVYFDGGVSYGQFWTEGDRIFADLRSVLDGVAEGRASGPRALLVGALTRSAHHASLSVRNTGTVEARDLGVRVDGESVPGHKLFHPRTKPVTNLGPGATVEFRMFTFDGMEDSYSVELDWTDRSGIPGRWRSDLTL